MFLRRFSFLAVLVIGCVSFASQALSQSNAYDTVLNNGDSANRVDIIFIGDGYQSSELETDYVTHINNTLNHFFTEAPLSRYQNFFNVHRVNVASNESGADKPLDNIYVDTALDASYSWGGNVERCLYFNTSKANNAVNLALTGTTIDVDMRLGTVNDSKYGGCGGQWGVYAGANSAANEIALHEIGHSFANLADEYYYNNDHYNGSEPSAWNLTTVVGNGSNGGKWDRWLGYDDPSSDIGVIGYYEGGGYHATGIYRPSDNSKMRALNRPFDAISREKFINDIYEEVDPLDNWEDNANTLIDPDEIWVEVVDANVIEVEWFVDGDSYGVHGENFDIQSLGLAEGDYVVEAYAYDTLIKNSFTGNALDWWRLDAAPLEQRVSWNISVSAIPEPGSAWLMLVLLGCGLKRRRKKQR